MLRLIWRAARDAYRAERERKRLARLPRAVPPPDLAVTEDDVSFTVTRANGEAFRFVKPSIDETSDAW